MVNNVITAVLASIDPGLTNQISQSSPMQQLHQTAQSLTSAIKICAGCTIVYSRSPNGMRAYDMVHKEQHLYYNSYTVNARQQLSSLSNVRDYANHVSDLSKNLNYRF